MKKGIIFDMDGTLWDSAVNVCRSWDMAVEKCGYSRPPITEEEMQSVMGKTMDKIAEILFPGVAGQARDHLLAACCEEENRYLRAHGGVLYPQLRGTLERLKVSGYHLYIVSNCQSGYIEAFLDYYQFWDLFEDRQCYGDNGLQKGENIRILAQRNQLERTVYVGDIQGDYEASREAGVLFIHAAYGFGKVEARVPAISRFCELPDIIDKVMI